MEVVDFLHLCRSWLRSSHGWWGGSSSSSATGSIVLHATSHGDRTSLVLVVDEER